MTTNEISGLDLEETIVWYNQARINVDKYVSDEILPYKIKGKKNIQLTENELSGLLYLFPENARERSVNTAIVGERTSWFDRKSTDGSTPVETYNMDDAISETAFVPSKYELWKDKENKLRTNVVLYKIPESLPERTIKILLSQGFVHEIAHSIVSPAQYSDCSLKFQTGEIMSGKDAVLKFGEIAEKYTPMSHYSSVFRDEFNHFQIVDKFGKKISIEEELCECITARLLGFTYCKELERRLHPFLEREEIGKYVDDFLYAKIENLA